ncbi:hypothetical protein [Chromobacterium paludis]|uniref:Uncharacterized protein n=1 Tax=Chromobacterium paludis TaxID=2605945 RepID=A0A5C1DLT1_9NEIS|nr:hypothetical protein [Chromobacterium paludis]QEL57631.1 hypothetical protein FYK34_19675 [Chromobacterium paludis]
MITLLSQPPLRPRRGRALAIGASVLLHVLTLLYLRIDHTPVPAWRETPLVQVRILPITPSAPASALAQPAPAIPPAAARPVIAAQSSARPTAPAQSPALAARAHPRRGKADASAAKDEPRLTMEGLRQQMRRLEPENPNAKPLREDPDKAKLASSIDSAQRADCKNAYASLGLLAAPMLLKDAFDKDNGCKW